MSILLLLSVSWCWWRERVGKPSEPVPSLKKKAPRTASDSAQNSKAPAAQSSRKNIVSSTLKERKMSGSRRQSSEAREEKKCKHCDGTKHSKHCSNSSRSSKELVKEAAKKHRLAAVSQHELRQDGTTKKPAAPGVSEKQRATPDHPDPATKKHKLTDAAGSRWDEGCVDTKHQRKANSRGLQQGSKKERTDNDSATLQLLEGRTKADKNVVMLADVDVKREEVSDVADRDDSSKAGLLDKPHLTTDRDGSGVVVKDKEHSNDRDVRVVVKDKAHSNDRDGSGIVVKDKAHSTDRDVRGVVVKDKECSNDREGSGVVVKDKAHSDASKTGQSRDAARQHVCHGLYRALSSR